MFNDNEKVIDQDTTNRIELIVDNRKVVIDNIESIIVTDTIINGVNSKIKSSFELTISEREKVFSLAEKTHKHKSYSINILSCYAGYRFYYETIQDSDTFSINEKSTSNWTSIFPEFIELNEILKSKEVFLKN